MKTTYGFLIHARYLEDVYKKFPSLRILPKNVTLWMLKKMPAVFISEIIGLKDKNGNIIKGYVGRMPLITHQMFEDRKLAVEKMKDAIKIFQKKGVNLIGLGGLTSSISGGGQELINHFKDIRFTTGRTYTVKSVTDYLKQIIEEFGFDKSEVKIAIVGAAGSIGSGCAEVLACYQINNLLLIDLERKLDVLIAKINDIHSKSSNKSISIEVSHKINDVREADIIIAATSAPEAVIRESDLKSGAIIVNDAQPSDVAPDVYERDDVLVIEGGVIKTPGIRIGFNIGLVEKDDSFSCLGEALALAREDLQTASGNLLDFEYLELLSEASRELNFSITKYQNQFGYISDEKINAVKAIINK